MAIPRSLGSSQVTFRSPIRISPVSTSSRPAMAFKSVDLPQPEGPTMATNSPFEMLRSMGLREGTAPPRVLYVLVRPAMAIWVPAASALGAGGCVSILCSTALTEGTPA